MNWYQVQASRTLKHDYSDITPKEVEILNLGACIGEEAGEIYGALKKQIIHKHGLDTEKIAEEIGDCLWYLAGLATTLGLDLEDIMVANIDKLQVRYPKGFDIERSKNRKGD
jgi:NTP pyrophosphatase (non-canonical NTP hydrolase)